MKRRPCGVRREGSCLDPSVPLQFQSEWASSAVLPVVPGGLGLHLLTPSACDPPDQSVFAPPQGVRP